MELKTHKTILHNGICVTEATLTLVDKDNFDKKGMGKGIFPVKHGNGDAVVPVLCDEIGVAVGDWELHVGKWLHKKTENTSHNSDLYKRVIALPVHLPDGFIDLIAEGRLKNGDKILIECEERRKNANWNWKWNTWQEIKFDKKEKVIVHFEEKKYTFDQLLKYQTEKGYNAVDFQTKSAKQKLEKWCDINRP